MLDAVVVILLGLGLVVFAGTTMGLLRFPDFYTRVHAAGKGDTLSTVLLLSGFALYHLHPLDAAALLTGLKILLIVLFIFIASPTATHAIIDAGYEAGVRHWARGATNPPSRSGSDARRADHTA
ncbi:MAG: monovalent cation/H(+) antiporter subunit G [Thermodesulfobacteriota bacterium]|jgi:multicomponent Na+:H+ antiporter subunit G